MYLITFLQAQPNNMIANVVFIGVIIVVFYFFMLRPQQKKQKEQKAFRESMKVGDKVVTIGGAHGKIVEINADTVVVDIDRGVKVTYEKSSISDELSKKVASKV
ncbi:MAG: preprotein translocase subunit YajC [Cytophagales bacterium]|nr:MAG: preprotein translocase subunit YajC [Cytophagales bacterium]